MKKWSLIVLLSTTLAAATAAAEVQTVAYVDLSKYVGKWHEIASIPQPFQKQCVSNTTAEYGTRPDGEIDVTNKCTKKNGDISVAEGRAKVVDTKTNAKLKVTFTRFFEWIYAFAGDYWIIGLDEEYKYAVVGHPTRDYAWILSRDPAMLQEDLATASEILKKQGYDTCKLMTTIQTGGIPEHTSLCEYLAKYTSEKRCHEDQTSYSCSRKLPNLTIRERPSRSASCASGQSTKGLSFAWSFFCFLFL